MTQRCKVRCIYVDGEPQPQVIMLLPHESAKVVVVIGCKVYIFTKEEAKEFLKRHLRLKDFEIGHCPNN